MPNNPESDLEAFLSSIAPYRRKALERGLASLSQNEVRQWLIDEEKPTGIWQEYEQLLKRIPARYREYRAREIATFAQIRASQLPAYPEGRPPKEDLANEALDLQRQDMTIPQIAAYLGRKHGVGTTTPEAIRKLLKRHADKT